MSRHKKKPKGVDAATIKFAISGLLVLTAIIHVLTALVSGDSPLTLPLYLFGALFLAAGAYVRVGGRTAVLVGVLVSALGLGIGGTTYLRDGGPVALPLMFLIDVLILAASAFWFRLSAKKA